MRLRNRVYQLPLSTKVPTRRGKSSICLFVHHRNSPALRLFSYPLLVLTMVFRYTPIGRSNQDRRQSATPMVPKRQRARQLLLYGPPVLLTLIILHVFFGSEKLPFRYKFKTADLDAASGYTPGTLGKRLLSRQRSVIGSSSTEDWEVLFSDPTEMAEDMFDLMAGRDEDACAGWGVEKEGGPELESRHNDKRGWDSCWRAKMHEQIGRWKMEDSK